MAQHLDAASFAGGLIGRVAQLPPNEFWAFSAATALAAAGLVFWGFVELRRARGLEDLPTSRIRSAAQGYVELCGRLRWLPGPEIVSPLSRGRCCWWSYRIERLERGADRRSSRWRTIESATSDDLFLIGDETGDCVVDPEGAEVVPSLRRRWRGFSHYPDRIPPASPWISFGEYRYTERLLMLGDVVHAVGWFRTQGHEHRFDETGDVRELLAEWKRDRQELLRRFDTNGDGQIDAGEWEQARRAALEQVRAEQVERSVDPDIHVLCRPPDRRRYLLSTVPQQQLVRAHRLRSVACLCGGAAASIGLGLAWQARGLW